MMAPDTNNNSYLLEVDGGTCYTVGDTGLAANQWGWVDYQSGNTSSKVTMTLSAGAHTFKLIGREPSVKIDRVMAILDGTCPTGPTGMGDNCMAETDTVAPVATVTAPAEGASVGGTVNVAATATDAKGVTKVDFYVDNALKQTDTTSPYSYSWDSSTTTNGSHNVTAKAYDAAGNIGSDTNAVTVKNGDAVAPSTPENVKATANTASKITVTWNASTDNTAVTGYTITRNNQVVATGVTGTSYVDNNVAAATSYSYRVSAYDAAGNTSAASTAVTVMTPQVADTTAPSAPANAAATAISTSQINVTWSASTDNVGVAGYDVYRSTPGADPAKVASVTTTSLGDTNLRASTQYSYYVIARDGNGNVSAKSATATATTQAVVTPPPSDGGGDTPTPQTTGIIRGKVTGGKRKVAISGARVTMVSDGKRYTATTNSEGVYRFDNLPAGRYSITYKATGYQPGDERLRLTEGDDLVWNMWLEKNGEKTSWWNRW
jgi:chitodextrinase